MLQTLVSTAERIFADLNRAWRRESSAAHQERRPAPAAESFGPLKRITLTDEVARTLFEEYAAHRHGDRGDDETGWILLGLRKDEEAVALATLPAGTQCSAGVAHVQFNSTAQALASRIVRQRDRRLRIIGVVHTHPGSLRHPSDGDFRGDSVWVRQLKGGEGVFGIGTADHRSLTETVFAIQPKPHVHCLGELRLTWYSLRKSDTEYRPLTYNLTLGPDLARPLHAVWRIIEQFADPLERLLLQQANVSFDVTKCESGAALVINIPLAEPEEKVCVVLAEHSVHYYIARGDDVFAVQSTEPRIDRGVYLLLAELAARN